MLVVSGGLLLALIATKLNERFPVPEPAVFLLLAAVASDVFPELGDRLSIREVEIGRASCREGVLDHV